MGTYDIPPPAVIFDVDGTHNMKNESHLGSGKWKQCTKCGATFHHKRWWLAGWFSEKEPPCPVKFDEQDYKEWIESSDRAGMDTF